MTVTAPKSPVWGITAHEIPWDDKGLVWAMSQDYRTSWDEPEDPVFAYLRDDKKSREADEKRRADIERMMSSLQETAREYPEPPSLDVSYIESPPPLPPQDEARLRSRLIGSTRHVVDL